MLSKLAQAEQVALQRSAGGEFLLASYYVDGRTLAEIGLLLHVHEATISRRLRRTTDDGVATPPIVCGILRRPGLSRKAAEEALGTDPRDVDLKMDLKKLLQSSVPDSFPERAIRQQRTKTLAGALLADNEGSLSSTQDPVSEKAKSAG